MRTGMLWFDESKESLAERIVRAAAFYREKYGKEPTHCYTNPATDGVEERMIDGLKICPEKTIMQNYFLIGVADEVRNPN